jgi:hypothetical protein
MAIPMAAGRAAANRPTSSASLLRGQGHCPKRRRLASSMATMATAADWRVRGIRA